MGVTTTGIYCRPICPAPLPKAANVRYFPSAAAAAAAGFRPCLRCRPETAPGTPAWGGTSTLVSRALRLIDEGGLDDGQGVEELADRLGVTGRHLRRLFLRHLGATPVQVAATRRLQFAKKLIDGTDLHFTEIAFSSGFGSIRGFNREIRESYGRTPTELRLLARPLRSPIAAQSYSFRLAYRPPYDWSALLGFLRARATPGVEQVDGVSYRRSIAVGGCAGRIVVRRAENANTLELEVRFPNPHALLHIVTRVRQIFDLAADPSVVSAQLRRDPLLARLLARHPGLRVPGAWDGFEVAVRAILGQQLSVAAATTVAGRLVSRLGTAPWPDSPERLFPSPAQLARSDLEREGVVPAGAEAIRELARRAESGSLQLNPGADTGAAAASLMAIPGVGAWTAQYIVMRACREPDAFPSGDPMLRRGAGTRTVRELERRAEAWRPWRSYAALLLWQDAAERASRAARSAAGVSCSRNAL
jgi:AraC family transcriptional regulator of adaptative response / DNA-3-methyladenine glycosylase II